MTTALQAALPTPGNKKGKANLTHAGEGSKDIAKVAAKRAAAMPIRERARALLEDEEYVENLQKRLRAGEAGPVEIWLHRYAYGDPKPSKADEEEERQHFERVRAEVSRAIQHGGKEARVLDITIQRSSRKLKRLAHPRDGNGDDSPS